MPSALRGAVCASIALTALACTVSKPPRGPVSEPAERDSARPAALASPRPLPAGLYFRDHVYDSCEGQRPCPTPSVAVAEVTTDEAHAEGALERLAALPLEVGYPFALHTDELGLEDPGRLGVAVIAGLFASVDEAQRWRETLPADGALELLALADSDVAHARHYESSDMGHYRLAVQLVGAAPIPAYAAENLDAIERRQEHEARGDADYSERAVAALGPICTLRPGRIFIVESRQLDANFYEWAPVRCGRRDALVRWRATRLMSTVRRRPDGLVVLRQVSGAECDSPSFEERPYPLPGESRSSSAAAPPPADVVCMRRSTCADWRGCVAAVPATGPIIQACCRHPDTGRGFRPVGASDPRPTLLRSEICPDGTRNPPCYETLDDGACGGPFQQTAPDYRCAWRGGRCEPSSVR